MWDKENKTHQSLHSLLIVCYRQISVLYISLHKFKVHYDEYQTSSVKSLLKYFHTLQKWMETKRMKYAEFIVVAKTGKHSDLVP